MQTNYDVLIIGGGLPGVACALKVAETGRSVLLVERRPALGWESTWAGQLVWEGMQALVAQRVADELTRVHGLKDTIADGPIDAPTFEEFHEEFLLLRPPRGDGFSISSETRLHVEIPLETHVNVREPPLPKHLALLHAHSVDEIRCADALLPWKLEFDHVNAPLACGNPEYRLARLHDFPGLTSASLTGEGGPPNPDLSTPEGRLASWPGIDAAHTIVNPGRGCLPIDDPILPGQRRRI